MSKIDDLRKLAADKSTTPAERKAAEKIANKLAGGDVVETISLSKDNAIVVSSAENLMVMPPWIRGRHSDFPHYETLYKIKRHPAFCSFRLAFAPRDPEGWGSYYVRDEFVFKMYGNSGIIKVSVYFDSITTETSWPAIVDAKHIEIYYEGDGWRDGPWWPRFLRLIDTMSAEVKAYEAEEERQRTLEKQRKQNQENILFSNYLKGIK